MKNPKKFFLLTTLGIAASLFFLLWRQLNWKCYWAWWIALSLTTFVVYWFDKFQSKKDSAQRVPELVLHVLALAGGVAGAWVGRTLFRHKTLHLKFTLILIASTVLHLALLVFFVLKIKLN